GLILPRYLRGNLYFKSGNYKEAEIDFTEVWNKFKTADRSRPLETPFWSDFFCHYLDTLEKNENFDQAIKVCNFLSSKTFFAPKDLKDKIKVRKRNFDKKNRQKREKLKNEAEEAVLLSSP